MVQKRKPDEGAIEEEETFVRGGGSGLAPVVKKQLEQVHARPTGVPPALETLSVREH
jgi:hypothetical protein